MTVEWVPSRASRVNSFCQLLHGILSGTIRHAPHHLLCLFLGIWNPPWQADVAHSSMMCTLGMQHKLISQATFKHILAIKPFSLPTLFSTQCFQNFHSALPMLFCSLLRMFRSLGLFVGLMLVVGVANAVPSTSNFDKLFQPSWAFDHFVHEGDLLKIKLDNYSGKTTVFFFCFF